MRERESDQLRLIAKLKPELSGVAEELAAGFQEAETRQQMADQVVTASRRAVEESERRAREAEDRADAAVARAHRVIVRSTDAQRVQVAKREQKAQIHEALAELQDRLQAREALVSKFIGAHVLIEPSAIACRREFNETGSWTVSHKDGSFHSLHERRQDALRALDTVLAEPDDQDEDEPETEAKTLHRPRVDPSPPDEDVVPGHAGFHAGRIDGRKIPRRAPKETPRATGGTLDSEKIVRLRKIVERPKPPRIL
jgi:hypothetical protein